MQETPEDLHELQALIDRSMERAGAFLRSSFQMPDHSLSAAQLACCLQGLQTVAFATVTRRGDPRVAPIAVIFYRGQFYIPTVLSAARTQHIGRHSAVSLTHFAGNDLAIIVHGQARLVRPGSEAFATVEQLHRTLSADGTSVSDWGEGVYLQIHAEALYTFVRQPDTYPDELTT
jgi:hypothetical protein